jgi:hypothetical protein
LELSVNERHYSNGGARVRPSWPDTPV